MNTTAKIILGTGLALASLLPARAVVLPVFVNFDDLVSGSPVNAFAPGGSSAHFGMYVPLLDVNGDPIAGSEHWEPDLTAPPVLAENPAAFGYGSAPSPTNALNALDGTVLISFDAPLDFGAFSFVLDNSAFGTAFPVSVEFFDATDALLASYSIDQTVPGLAFTSGALNGVSKVVLPGGAFYDNFAVVPEPSAFLSVLGGMGILLGFRRRA